MKPNRLPFLAVHAAILASIPAGQAVWAQNSEINASITAPPPPPESDLPEIEQVITDEEFDARVPDIAPEDDPELNAPLESIAEFERRLEEQERIEGAIGESAPPPSIADFVTDPEILAPLPPLETFVVEPVEFAEAASDSDSPEIEYAFAVEGLDALDDASDIGLTSLFYEFSTLRDGDGKAANVTQLRARLTDDADLLRRILASEGWYSAMVDTRIRRDADEENAPFSATIAITPGPRYVFSDIVIAAEVTTPPGLIADNLALDAGQPVIAGRVQAAEAQVALALPQNGYPFAEIGQRDILLDQEEGSGIYTLPVDIGPKVVFGGIETTGESLAFDAEHIALLARFERGDIYDSRKIDDLRQALIATGLFSTVSVAPEQTGEAASETAEFATVIVEQTPGPPRTIAGSAGFGTGQGFRVEGSWTHRNLFPPEGALIASGVLGTQEQGLSTIFRRANAGRRDRTFQFGLEAYHSDFDAYEAYTGRLFGLLTYDSTPIWQKPFTYAIGAQIIATNEEDFDATIGDLDRRTFFIGGLTAQLGVDRTDSLLDPTEGFRLTALIEPEGSLEGGFTPYARTRIDGSAYYPVGNSIVLAGRLRVGSIKGVDTFDIAPSRRFYAGGGGSVRGFGFQELGPQARLDNPNFDATDPDETADPFIFRPLGGRSIVEASGEIRYRFGDYGLAAFVDAGQVYDRTVPDFSDLRFGAGIGARYYTNFGPLRFDVAVPIDRRDGESSFAVYVGIGQAF